MTDKLRIYDTSLTFKGQIDNFESLEVVRKYRGIEVLTMTIQESKTNVDQLIKHYWVTIGDKKNFEIEHIEYVFKAQVPTLRIVAYGGAKTMKKRSTIPPVGQAYDRITSSSPEFIVKEWFDRQLVNAVDTDRNIPYLEIATNQDRGTIITDQTRYKKLHEEVDRILTADDIGYSFELNTTTKKLIFDVYEGIDRTVQTGSSPAIFSVKYDNILDQKYITSAVANQNQMIVAGQGAGAARTIVEVGSFTSYERYESFIDARDTNDTTELTNRGIAAQVVDFDTLAVRLDPNANLTYEEDFDLGDVVTIQIPDFNIEFNQRITEVKEKYTAGNPARFDLNFGIKFKSLYQNIIENKTNITNLEVV